MITLQKPIALSGPIVLVLETETARGARSVASGTMESRDAEVERGAIGLEGHTGTGIEITTESASEIGIGTVDENVMAKGAMAIGTVTVNARGIIRNMIGIVRETSHTGTGRIEMKGDPVGGVRPIEILMTIGFLVNPVFVLNRQRRRIGLL